MFGLARVNSIAQYSAPAGPTYAFGTPTPSAIDETGTQYVTFPVNTTGVADGIIVYAVYFVNGSQQSTTMPTTQIDGNTQTDIVSGYGANLVISAVADLTTEGPQTLYAQLYSDAARTQLVATSQSVTINDTSRSAPAISFVASATSLATTIVIPASAAAGDIAVLFDSTPTSAISFTVPTGFSSISSVTNSSTIRTNISYKSLVAGDSGTTIGGMNGTTRKVLLVFRPSSTLNSISTSMNTGQVTTAVPTNQSLSLLSAAKPHIAFAVYTSSGAVATRGWTQTGGTPTEVSSVSTSGIYVKYQINNAVANPQNVTISMSDGGTNALQSGRIAFT
jgi:hypothetical protein